MITYIPWIISIICLLFAFAVGIVHFNRGPLKERGDLSPKLREDAEIGRGDFLIALSVSGKPPLEAFLEYFVNLASVRCGSLAVYENQESSEIFFHSTIENDSFPISAFNYFDRKSILKIFRNNGLQPADLHSPIIIRIKRLPFLLPSTDKTLSTLLLPFMDSGELIAVLSLMYISEEYSPKRTKELKDIAILAAPYLREIVKRKAAEAESVNSKLDMRRLSTQFSNIFNNSRDAIVLCSKSGSIVDLNDAARELSGGMSKEKYIGKPINGFYSSGLSLERLLAYVNSQGTEKEIELMFHHNDGTVHYGLATPGSTDKTGGDTEDFFLIIKDITERMIRDAELMKTNTELEILNNKLKEQQTQMIQQEKLASIGQLSAGIAHEINNPLAFVQSNIDTLSFITSKAKDSQDDLSDIIEETKSGIQRISNIVKSLKDFSHSDNSPVEADVREMLENTLTVSSNSYKYFAQVSLNLEYEGPLVCYSDKLGQVFLNLIINAAQAIESQNRSELGQINIETRRAGKYLRFVFEDDGPGIPAESKNRIFEPFYTTKDVGKGTGLGLSIAREIVVKLHMGNLSLVSSDANGTVFHVDIPMDEDLTSSDLEEI